MTAANRQCAWKSYSSRGYGWRSGARTHSIALITALLCLTACGDRISGTYGDEQGVTTYEFDPDGRMNITVLGTNVAAEYAVDGDRILVTSPQGTIVLTRQGDRLLGPMGMELNLQRDQAKTPVRSDEKRK